MQKTLSLSVPLLDDKSMLEALLTCQRNLERTKTILEETHYLREHLEEKRVNYIPVANHATMLYQVIQRISVLSPYYHMSLATFVKVVADTVHERQRGKGSIGK